MGDWPLAIGLLGGWAIGRLGLWAIGAWAAPSLDPNAQSPSRPIKDEGKGSHPLTGGCPLTLELITVA